MLVQCRCGQKLKVKDSVIGKKIRCPKCQGIFTAQTAEDDDEDSIVPDTSRNRSRPGRAESEPIRKKKAARQVDDDFDDDDDDYGDDDDDSTRPSAKKRKRSAQGKKGVSLARNIVAGVVLAVLVVVAVVLYMRKLSPPGTLKLEVMMADVDVFVDGKKQVFSVENKLAGVGLTIDLQPGTHEIKVSKDGYHPFTKEITVTSRKTEVIRVDLKRIMPPRTELPGGQRLKDFAGTWLVNS